MMMMMVLRAKPCHRLTTMHLVVWVMVVVLVRVKAKSGGEA